MAKKKPNPVEPKTAKTSPKTSQARLELPAPEMERVRRAARSVGLGLSAFIRLAVLEKTADTEKRMGPMMQ
jgi:hypothetical protein